MKIYPVGLEMLGRAVVGIIVTLAGQAENSGSGRAALALDRWADLSCRWNNEGYMKMDGSGKMQGWVQYSGYM